MRFFRTSHLAHELFIFQEFVERPVEHRRGSLVSGEDEGLHLVPDLCQQQTTKNAEQATKISSSMDKLSIKRQVLTCGTKQTGKTQEIRKQDVSNK